MPYLPPARSIARAVRRRRLIAALRRSGPAVAQLGSALFALYSLLGLYAVVLAGDQSSPLFAPLVFALSVGALGGALLPLYIATLKQR